MLPYGYPVNEEPKNDRETTRSLTIVVPGELPTVPYYLVGTREGSN